MKKSWEAKRAAIVSSPAFLNMFAKARKAAKDPSRKKCNHGHAITAANAHVGDMKRTGRYTCDVCNRKVQARYAKAKK